MKKAEIKTDGTRYRAKIEYLWRGCVEVLEVGVERPGNYRKPHMDGVRVRLALPMSRSSASASSELPAGHETVIATREIEREWTDEDQARHERFMTNLARGEVLREALRARLGDEAMEGVTVAHGTVGLSFDVAERLFAVEAVVG